MTDERQKAFPVDESRGVHAAPCFQNAFHKLGQKGTLQRVAEGDVDVLFRNVMQRGHEKRVVGDDHGAAFSGMGMFKKFLFQFQQLGVQIVSGVKAYVRATVSLLSQQFTSRLPAGEPFFVFGAAPVSSAGEDVRIGMQADSGTVHPEVAEQNVLGAGEAHESGQNDALALKLERKIGIGSGKLRRVLGVQTGGAQTACAQR